MSAELKCEISASNHLSILVYFFQIPKPLRFKFTPGMTKNLLNLILHFYWDNASIAVATGSPTSFQEC